MMIKTRIDYSDGQYYASLIEDDAVEWERAGYCVVSIPEDKAVEWREFNDKAREWQKYWRELNNQFFEEKDSDIKIG